MKKYYLNNNEQQEGPFDINELINKNITAETEVWFEGLTDWTAAGQIEELKHLFTKATPPPIKPKSNHKSSKAGSKQSNIKTYFFKLGLIGVLLFIGFYAIAIYIDENSSPDPNTYVKQKMTIAEFENANPLSFLSASGNYNSSFWGTELKIRGEITNTATVANYKDVTLRVTYYSKTKSVITTRDYTLYEVYQPSSVTPFRLDITNYKDVNSIGWEVVRALSN